jgi:hypothetical protein
MRIVSLILAFVLFFTTVIFISGYTAQPSYSGSVSFDVSYSTQLTWQELLNIQDMPRRKADVRSVDVLEEYGKLVAWQENLKNGGYRIYRMTEREEAKRLVIELTDSSYGLTGVWAFDIVQQNNKTVILISEESMLSNIWLRGLRVFLGRNHDLLIWAKYIKVGLIQALLITP